MDYEARGYYDQKAFDDCDFILITEGVNKFTAFQTAGLALIEDFQIVKVQSEDREDITVLRRD